MYCGNCGKENVNQSIFCAYCGNKFENNSNDDMYEKSVSKLKEEGYEIISDNEVSSIKDIKMDLNQEMSKSKTIYKSEISNEYSRNNYVETADVNKNSESIGNVTVNKVDSRRNIVPVIICIVICVLLIIGAIIALVYYLV